MLNSFFLTRAGIQILVVLLPIFAFSQGSKKMIDLINTDVSNQFSFSQDEKGVQDAKRWQLATLNPVQGENQISINLFEDAPLAARLMQVDKHLCGITSYTYHLSKQQWGYFILSEKHGKVMGKIENDAGQIFIITPIEGKPYYVVKELEYEPQDETDGGHLPMEENQEEDVLKPEFQLDGTTVCDAGATCPSQMVKMLVVYSAAARLAMGGTSGAEMSIANAVTEMNMTNTNSGVNHMFNLVHTEEVSYTESADFPVDLSRLRNPTDGFMDNVHELRDQYYADVVSLILTNSGGCGYGNVNTDPASFSSGSGFSVASTGCMITNRTLTHEVGHNMGLFHDRYVVSTPGNAACDWAFGYVNQAAFAMGAPSNKRWRTVLAYNNQCVDAGFGCTRLPYWSNPDMTYTSDPMGIAIGQMDAAHSTYFLNRSICQVSAFRTEPCTNCTIYQDCAQYNLTTGSGPGNTTVLTIPGPFTTANPGDIVQLCIDTRGDHSASTEVFNVKDENGNTLGQTLQSEDCRKPVRICFSLSVSTYNTWIANGNVVVSLDPVSTSIDPVLCSGANRACAALLYTPASVACQSGGIFSGMGGTEDLSSGVYHYDGPVTLSGYNIPDPEIVTIKSTQEITLNPVFTIEFGATFTLDIEACPTAVIPYRTIRGSSHQ